MPLSTTLFFSPCWWWCRHAYAIEFAAFWYFRHIDISLIYLIDIDALRLRWLRAIIIASAMMIDIYLHWRRRHIFVTHYMPLILILILLMLRYYAIALLSHYLLPLFYSYLLFHLLTFIYAIILIIALLRWLLFRWAPADDYYCIITPFSPPFMIIDAWCFRHWLMLMLRLISFSFDYACHYICHPIYYWLYLLRHYLMPHAISRYMLITLNIDAIIIDYAIYYWLFIYALLMPIYLFLLPLFHYFDIIAIYLYFCY